jgi:8-oxo-dGTP diphosphatase
MSEIENRPKVGIGVLVFKDGKVLLGKRKGSHGHSEYAGPGGHLEHMESIEDCAKREVMEETGIEIYNIRFIRLLNMKEYAPKHYIDIAVAADWKSGDPEVKEPEKCEAWDWYDLDKLPEPLFAAVKSSTHCYKQGINYVDN